MSSDSTSSSVMIELTNVSKHYPIQTKPLQRMWQALRGAASQAEDAPSYTALQPCNFQVRKGEVVGIVGKNGAGKSTLLQLVSATVQPSTGHVRVVGKISAILELGAGFNSEFTGRENIFLATATAGMSTEKTDALLEEIIDFSGIRPFIDQPIKTYSSGMVVRLAFSIATCSEPDVLIIDEALSVGDGEFARKSFDRILSLKNQGTTILFCTHSLFHIEAMCSRAIWLDQGKILSDDHPSLVIPAYQDYLDGVELSQATPLRPNEYMGAKGHTEQVVAADEAAENGLSPSKSWMTPWATEPYASQVPSSATIAPEVRELQGYARLRTLSLRVVSPTQSVTAFKVGEQAQAKGQADSLVVVAKFESDPKMAAPSFAVTLHSLDGRIIGSAGAWNDGVLLQRSPEGAGWVELTFPAVALLKGTYTLSAFLFCERGLHIYDNADHFIRVQVSQDGIEQGLFHVPRQWNSFSQTPAAITDK